MSSEYSNSRRSNINPFIPSISPSIVVDKHLVVTNVGYLGFEPLVDSILSVNPLPNFELPVFKVKLPTVRKILWIFIWLLLLSLSISKPPIVEFQKVFWFQCFLVRHTRVHQALGVFDGSAQDVEAFSLVEPYLFQIVPCILLENKSSVSSQNRSFVESPHYFLDKVNIVSSCRNWRWTLVLSSKSRTDRVLRVCWLWLLFSFRN